jgi:hypothetical protein
MSAANNTAPALIASDDPIAVLIAYLSAAAATGAEMTLGSRAQIKTRRVPSGFAIERSSRR